MYLRLKNLHDYLAVEMSMAEFIDNRTVSNRIKEVLTILDYAYGAERSSKAMGGYVFLFTDQNTYDNYIGQMLEINHIDREMYEYSDTISNSNDKRWQEELYLVSSDDSVTVIHPIERE